MVFAFLSHSLASIPRVFYSAVYGDDLQIAAGEVVYKRVDSIMPGSLQSGCPHRTPPVGPVVNLKNLSKLAFVICHSSKRLSCKKKNLYCHIHLLHSCSTCHTHIHTHTPHHTIQGTPVDSLRSIRKEQLMVVACRVQSEYGMRMAARDNTDE